ncbi:hypothetical protein WOLCODRAFT_135385 [Wolfiporia cocos MD-104 SS10]|uniref:Uncharacterized protein n=1 Tax=Wolfiporia cocos (strain MD-104) TaxID=742152 RepID=A0A2H3J8E0_WOLCO|nr:hypothetical protein WOLCODRAFT_135385 [Wolfiporia cocos MD-104 SS10]
MSSRCRPAAGSSRGSWQQQKVTETVQQTRGPTRSPTCFRPALLSPAIAASSAPNIISTHRAPLCPHMLHPPYARLRPAVNHSVFPEPRKRGSHLRVPRSSADRTRLLSSAEEGAADDGAEYAWLLLRAGARIRCRR